MGSCRFMGPKLIVRCAKLLPMLYFFRKTKVYFPVREYVIERLKDFFYLCNQKESNTHIV